MFYIFKCKIRLSHQLSLTISASLSGAKLFGLISTQTRDLQKEIKCQVRSQIIYLDTGLPNFENLNRDSISMRSSMQTFKNGNIK